MKKSRFNDVFTPPTTDGLKAQPVIIQGTRKSGKVELLAGEKCDGESIPAMIACNDFMRMGPSRSIAGLQRKYAAQTAQREPSFAPTTSLITLRHWSMDYGWFSRAEIYDARMEELKDNASKAILETGLSLAYNRVLALKRLVSQLEAELSSKLWVKDIKVIGVGKYAERVEVLRFNYQLVEQYRSALDDLSKEVGGRVKRADIKLPGSEEGTEIHVTIGNKGPNKDIS